MDVRVGHVTETSTSEYNRVRYQRVYYSHNMILIFGVLILGILSMEKWKKNIQMIKSMGA